MEGNIDRISALHDALLEHILSFLPTKYAVRTSVLSKRWKYLWLSQTSVSVDGNDLTDDDHSIGLDQVQSYILYHDDESNSTKFVNFVDKLLLNRGRGMPIIKKLQLSCREGVRASEFARWLGSVLRDGLEELDLEFRIISKKPLSCLVPCNSLVTLKLNVGAFSGHKFPESFYFPNLKTMHLRGFTLANNFTYQLMNCRKLENLILYYFMFDILLFQDDQIANGNDQQEILPNLNNAWIDCPCAFRGVNSARLFMKNLITVLSKAKLLDLSLSVMEYLYIEPKFPDHMPKFNNLKHLKICLQAYQIGVMSYLMQMTPNLESLHIELYQPYGDHDELMLEHLHSSCSRANLKVIRLSHLNPEDNRQMELVRLFFESAGFLEKIVIELDEIAAMNPFLQCQKLLELPRLSESCVLDVKWDNGSRTFTLCN